MLQGITLINTCVQHQSKSHQQFQNALIIDPDNFIDPGPEDGVAARDRFSGLAAH